MTKRLLIDASHAEETRVVVLDGNRLEDFDVETQSRRQLKGNIYLAKVVRVEPSLQAAFVEYGGNRHGFLAFGEIHPDYYQIPVADRQRLLELQEEEARAEEAEEEAQAARVPATEADDTPGGSASPGVAAQTLLFPSEALSAADLPVGTEATSTIDDGPTEAVADASPLQVADLGTDTAPEASEPADPRASMEETAGQSDADVAPGSETDLGRVRLIETNDSPAPESVGGDTEATEDARAPRQPSRFMRSYKIQEVIRRRQILLIQVVKEERGTKGAALTTYISLAGRYCVLMPNSPRGGGISRKITSAADRRRLKEVTAELDIPRGMGLIVRTAGAARPKAEINRDGEYLLRLWDDIREQTMQSMAPSLIHEEASLIKRAIRDVYSRDVDELLVDGEEGWRAARDYMRVLMPTHVKKVQLWPANAQPLFAHNQVESMLDSMLNPTVQLRSGGYLVINQTEALVAIDVNSGRSTRERGIEETALRTNLEAADEAARQLRLRDLAGLIVIDFIDMESKKHNSMVERRMADALRHDRARIQVGHISHFGLLELSRQRLRPSLAETSLTVCAQCGGSGHVRSTESAALHVLREIEEEGGKRRASEIVVHVASSTALYILNNKRQRLTEIEARYGMAVCFSPDESLLPAQTRIDRVRAASPQDLPVLPAPLAQSMPDDDAGEADIADDEDNVEMGQTRLEAGASVGETLERDFSSDADHVPGETAAEGEQRRRRRRRRRRGVKREDGSAVEVSAPMPNGTDQPDIAERAASQGEPAVSKPVDAPEAEMAVEAADFAAQDAGVPAAEMPSGTEAVADDAEADSARAKRGRRGGRRRRKPTEETETQAAEPPQQEPLFPAYVGPTPADPFALSGLDIFDALERAEMIAGSVVAEAPQPTAEMATNQDNIPVPGDPDFGLSTNRPEPVVVAAPQPEAEMTVGQQETSADGDVQPDLSSIADQTHSPHTPALPNGTPGAAAEPVAGPALQPTLIGTGKAITEGKKGWWRR